ncbi:hypothetical protein CVT26_004142 [Gymnopilus dilepis]|uniref:Uncharacterized protein n=1 Tax=Gymnopilus dilepis TaxID=231916 RepID=A0A409X982_9AGAR|nr:hypothetical protein CVT26_004142 [Gymnopilus dilepis]
MTLSIAAAFEGDCVPHPKSAKIENRRQYITHRGPPHAGVGVPPADGLPSACRHVKILETPKSKWLDWARVRDYALRILDELPQYLLTKDLKSKKFLFASVAK